MPWIGCVDDKFVRFSFHIGGGAISLACLASRKCMHVSKIKFPSIICEFIHTKSVDMAQVMRGWSEIRELLNRWNLLYRVDTLECYPYVEVMLKKGFDDLDYIVNMNDEALEKLTDDVGMNEEQARKFVDNVRQRYGIRQVCVVLQRGSFVMFV